MGRDGVFCQTKPESFCNLKVQDNLGTIKIKFWSCCIISPLLLQSLSQQIPMLIFSSGKVYLQMMRWYNA
jgi:hypothetical protein